AQRAHVPVEPCDRGAHPPDQLVHVDRREEAVVDHGDEGAERLERAGHEAEVGLVERHPVAAVDEEVDGRRAAALRRQEEVDRLPGPGPVTEVEPDRQRGPGPRALRGPARQVLGVAGDLAAVVVLAIQRLAVVLEEHRRAHGVRRHSTPRTPAGRRRAGAGAALRHADGVLRAGDGRCAGRAAGAPREGSNSGAIRGTLRVPGPASRVAPARRRPPAEVPMLPYRDENETQRTPVITLALIALNVLVWLLIQGAGSPLPLARSVCELGLIPGELTGLLPPGSRFPMGDGLVCLTDPGRQPLHLVSSMFLHGSWMHLIGNMWFLWLFGNNIEDSTSRPRFVVFYLICGLAAALAQVVTSPGSVIPMVGASGAISGVMGA